MNWKYILKTWLCFYIARLLKSTKGTDKNAKAAVWTTGIYCKPKRVTSYTFLLQQQFAVERVAPKFSSQNSWRDTFYLHLSVRLSFSDPLLLARSQYRDGTPFPLWSPKL